MNLKAKGKNKTPIILIAGAIVVLLAATVIVISLFSINKTTVNKEEFDKKVDQLEKYTDSGKWDDATKLANEILDMNPEKSTKVDVYWELALCQSYQKKFDKAIEYANTILKLDTPSGHFLLGLIYSDTKDYEKAKYEFKYASMTGPSYKQQADEQIAALDKLIAANK
ncbi:MAG: tetratricopeptide repeat protein [Bacillota bacterium]|nr:tetratricopeptide repeat protein [Bacillota bacterium]